MTPAKMKAIVTTGDKNIELREIDVPKPGPREALVKVVAAAQNPTDWKTVNNFPTEGNVAGCEYAGIVEELGPDANGGFKVGDRIAGLVHGNAHPNGAFAEYVAADLVLAVHIPDSWTFEEAAQLPAAGFTACMALYYAQKLPTPLEPTVSPIDILVWGGSSSVGQYVVQIAKHSGLCVLATCSPRNFDLVKGLGADEVFDYRDKATPARIKELMGNKLAHVVDCISEGDTSEQIAQAIGDKGGEVTTLLPCKSKRDDVKHKLVMAYMLLGKDVTIPIQAAADPEQRAFGIWAAKLLSDLLAAGKLRPSPIKIMPRGLASVEDGFEYMSSGKVSGEKIVYRIVVMSLD